MKGKLLGYDGNMEEGAIRGTDGNRYTFLLTEWKNENRPAPEIAVDFVPNEGYAEKVFPIRDNEAEETAFFLGIVSLLITFFLGFIGTLISRLALAKQPAHRVIVPVLIHAIVTLLFLVPIIGWAVYIVCTIYFMITNYRLINRSN